LLQPEGRDLRAAGALFRGAPDEPRDVDTEQRRQPVCELERQRDPHVHVGEQWEDRQLSRSRIIASGLLPGQQNINQGSVVTPFEENTHERTIALYGHEEWLGVRERLLLSGSVRAERSSANGDVKKFYFFPAATGSYR